jgi:hypothetical protein
VRDVPNSFNQVPVSETMLSQQQIPSVSLQNYCGNSDAPCFWRFLFIPESRATTPFALPRHSSVTRDATYLHKTVSFCLLERFQRWFSISTQMLDEVLAQDPTIGFPGRREELHQSVPEESPGAIFRNNHGDRCYRNVHLPLLQPSEQHQA